jgi:uncharacterized SAM-binding protein YcdF (DUF218 family)
MAGLLFALKKIIAGLVLPPAILVLIGITGLLLLRRSPRVARVLLWSMVTSLLLLSLPVVERYLMRGLSTPPLTEQRARTTQAILILGGGIARATPEYGDTLSRYSLERVRYGAVLARRLHLPILVSGGQAYGGRPEGEVMAEVLRNEFAVDVRWIESRSQDTADNLVFSAEILRRNKLDSVLLVTSDFHMARALRECGATGLKCIGGPVTTYAGLSDSWIEELPNPSAFTQSAIALHELLGLLAQRLH